MSNQKKKKSLKNINLGHQLLLKTFSDKSNFKNNLFLNHAQFLTNRHLSMKFLENFPSSMLVLGQKSCFLGPTIFEIPQFN